MSTAAQPPPSDSPGSWLTHQMERKSISVRRLADALGVTDKTVYGWRDDRGAVSETRIPKLAAALGISEIEARRGLGYWVPDVTSGSPPAMDEEELAAVEALLEQAIAELNRLKQRRTG